MLLVADGMREVGLLEFLKIINVLRLAPLHRATNVRHVREDFVLASGVGSILIILVKVIKFAIR